MDLSLGKYSTGPALALGCHRSVLESKLIACGLAASTMYEIPMQRRQKVDWLLKIHIQCNRVKERKKCMCLYRAGSTLLLKFGI